MKKYLILVSGTTKNYESVSVTIYADNISIAETHLNYAIDEKTKCIKFEDYQTLNILWQSDGFCGHLTKIIMEKGETK